MEIVIHWYNCIWYLYLYTGVCKHVAGSKDTTIQWWDCLCDCVKVADSADYNTTWAHTYRHVWVAKHYNTLGVSTHMQACTKVCVCKAASGESAQVWGCTQRVWMADNKEHCGVCIAVWVCPRHAHEQAARDTLGWRSICERAARCACRQEWGKYWGV